MTQNYKSRLSTGNLKESEIMEEFIKLSNQSEVAPVSPLFMRKVSVINDSTTKIMTSHKLVSPRANTVINRHGM